MEKNELDRVRGDRKYIKGVGWRTNVDEMKKIIRLTESDLKNVISNCVKKVLNEGGHLYHKDEDGNVYTNSKDTYRGVKGSTYIWHGEWADPTILWKGVELNATDVEESLWNAYKDFCEETGEQPTDSGFDAWAENEDIASTLDEVLWATQG